MSCDVDRIDGICAHLLSYDENDKAESGVETSAALAVSNLESATASAALHLKGERR